MTNETAAAVERLTNDNLGHRLQWNPTQLAEDIRLVCKAASENAVPAEKLEGLVGRIEPIWIRLQQLSGSMHDADRVMTARILDELAGKLDKICTELLALREGTKAAAPPAAAVKGGAE